MTNFYLHQHPGDSTAGGDEACTDGVPARYSYSQDGADSDYCALGHLMRAANDYRCDMPLTLDAYVYTCVYIYMYIKIYIYMDTYIYVIYIYLQLC